jgi:hypothetical protein
MGYLPADDPQLSILVILDDMTNTANSGGKVAAPVFASIGDFATRLFNMTPTTDAEPAVGRVRAKVELPPPPSTLETTTTTAPTTAPAGSVATTAAKAPVTTTRPPAAAAASAAPTTTRAATARAPTGAPSG